MKKLFKFLSFIKPYWKQVVFAMIFLICVVFMDLTIPRLVQRIIDEGIYENDLTLVVNTTLLMLGISVFYAIRDAIATEQKLAPELQAPATPEAVLKAIEAGQA